jgi:hypothetical protein
MVATLDENKYNEADLIQIKLPLNIPYTTDWKDYERYDGQVVLNGIHYNYVKRIVYNDTMYLYCVPNRQKTELSNTKNEYAKQVTDVPAGKKTEQSNAKRNCVTNEYNSGTLQYSFSVLTNSITLFSFIDNDSITGGFLNKPSQPPEIIG